MPRRSTNKHIGLAQNFAQSFTGSREFTSDELSKWADENGVPKDSSEVRSDHARRVVYRLRQSGPNPQMGESAFRIINRGWCLWEKQEITAKTIIGLQNETCEKMLSAANNGHRRNEKLCSVLLDRELNASEACIVAFSQQSYVMLRGTLEAIETNLQKLFKSLELSMGQQLLRLTEESNNKQTESE